MKEALFYKKLSSDQVQCQLCPKNCLINNQETGQCTVRQNIDGVLYSLIYNKTTSVAVDPIEKKPLYHFHPGEYILSLGSRGCNMNCSFCQNYRISQDKDVFLQDITKEQLAEQAINSKSFGIAYTYNEPFIWYEFVQETALYAKEKGLENVLVTNGYVNSKPLEQILPLIGAMNIDLKALDNVFYKDICNASLGPVLNTIRLAKEKTHIELTNLIVPTLNDSAVQFKKLVDWVYDNTGSDTVLHLSRYFPCYKLNLPPTPIQTMLKAKEIAEKKLKYVYLGNV